MSTDPEDFRLLGPLRSVQTIAAGSGVRDRSKLRSEFGGQRWFKKKGVALVEKFNGWIGDAEIHWYEANGVGRVDWKIKRQLEP